MSAVFEHSQLLCLACRQVGHQTLKCLLPGGSNRSFSTTEVPYANSQLCQRCSSFKIPDIINGQRLRDEKGHWEFIKTFDRGKSSWDPEWKEHYKTLRFELGPAPTILLYASCPLCRLIFAIFPSRDIDDWNIVSNPEPWFLRPYPPYDRTARWAADVPEDIRNQYAVYFTVEIEHTEWRQRLEDGVGAMQGSSLAFAAACDNITLKRKALAARRVDQKVDYELLRTWLKKCEADHGVACHKEWDNQILLCRMIDVEARKVINCPSNCEYAALSYVWGGVQPKQGALESKTLPRTIEDAITVTKQIGMKFLWVDALCVDQRPTAQQRQQLMMMDKIYAYASVTIIALSGTNADEGLPGVSHHQDVRKQAREMVDGVEMLTVGVTDATLLNSSAYFTRAWTMQEALFSKRRLMFTDQQVHFMCNRAQFCEAINEADDPAKYLESPEPTEFWMQVERSDQKYTTEQRRKLADEDYRQMVSNYTQRKMTNDRDSVNAFLGIESYLVTSWFLQPFTNGLPMNDFPTALGWYHDRSVKQPRRRHEFPSWSWAGWEGVVVYDRELDLAAVGDDDDSSSDMLPVFLDEDERQTTIRLEAVLVKLNIVTEPFSDAYTQDGDLLLGVVRERNFLHNNTIPSGNYEFMVIRRIKTKGFGDIVRESVEMLLLDRLDATSARRRTFVRLSLQKGVAFETARPWHSHICLQ